MLKKNTLTVETQTEERRVEVEMITPVSLEKTAVNEVEECANDDMVSVEQLQDFLNNSKLPCEKASSKSKKNQTKVKRIKN